jgi:hypothetical protein
MEPTLAQWLEQGGEMLRSAIAARSIRVVATVAALCVWATSALAYSEWSQNRDATNCGACHGDFRAGDYTSATDGMLWGNLHNIHRSDMLAGDCDTCHGNSGLFPVNLSVSAGGDGLDAISCVGCHGRAEDNTAENPDFPALSAYGSGLRQKHHNAGVTECADCHDDADPANYTPVAESVLPPYYANPGNNHPDMPDNTCATGGEDFAGDIRGLDNDGDGNYELDDSDCATPVEPATWGNIKSLYRLLME